MPPPASRFCGRAGAQKSQWMGALLSIDCWQSSTRQNDERLCLQPEQMSCVLRRYVEVSNSRTPFVLPGQYGKLKLGGICRFRERHVSVMMQCIVFIEGMASGGNGVA